MSGFDIPCEAYKYLRRKCVSGCIFAPHFSNEDAAAHFAPVDMVFGTSRISKLLSNLPVNDCCGAAMTIAYEAHARLEDPIYGCVSQIFALQQQVVNLEAQLASLHDQVVQSFLHDSLVETSSNTLPQLNLSHINNVGATSDYVNLEGTSSMSSFGGLQ